MRVVFIGTGEIGVPTLQSLAQSQDFDLVGVVTQPDKPAGRQLKLRASPIKEIALRAHFPIFQPEKINQPSAIAQLKYLKADVFVVMAYGQILSKTVLELPQQACLNVHASLLPKYRGASPIHAAIKNGDRYSGITIMWMDQGLDTGDILYAEKTVIRRDETTETLHNRLARMAPDALEHALKLLAKGKASRTPQKEAEASYAPRLKKEDGQINWTQPQTAIDCHIRAMTPWPGAYTWLPASTQPKMLKIYTTILSTRCKGKPGEIVRVDKHGILVAAEKGGVLLREVQLEGKRRMSAAEFARGFNLPTGTILLSENV